MESLENHAVAGHAPLLETAAMGRRHPTMHARWLLESISLAIPAGMRLAVAGPSGAGKTLLLRSLAKLDPIDAGEVLYNGHSIGRDEVPAFRAAVIYLHQRAALLDETVEAALRRPFALNVHRQRSFDQRRVLPWLAGLGRAEDFLKQRVENLSGGEIQIVALLRALQLDPAVLLLDEPTAALDPTTAAAVERMLVEWTEQAPGQRALVWVSHDAAQARRVAHHFIRLDGGRVMESSM